MKRFLYRFFRGTYRLDEWRLRHFTNTGMTVILCLVLSAVVGIDTTQSMAYQIFTFLLAMLTLAIVCSFFLRLRLSAARLLPRFATVGTALKYRVVIHNKTNVLQKGLKLFEDFADASPSFQEFLDTPEPLEEQRNPIDRAYGFYRWLWLVNRNKRATVRAIELPALPPYSQTEVTLEMMPRHRGVVRLNSLTIACPDPFGLFNACLQLALPQSLLILPKLYHLPPIRLPGLRRYQSGGVALASSVGDSEEFMSLREYRSGDPLRKIHWKSWAKVGKPIVREEQDEFFVRHALILDTFQTAKYSEILEEAISVAASFACEIQTQESLLDLMFVGPEAYCFTFGRGLSHTDRMLEILASVVACQDKPFDSLLPLVSDRTALLSGCICVFLTWDEQRQQLVEYLQGMQIPTLVLLLTEKEDSGGDGVHAENFYRLPLGKIQEGLMSL